MEEGSSSEPQSPLQTRLAALSRPQPLLLLPPATPVSTSPERQVGIAGASVLPDDVTRYILERLCTARDVAAARGTCRRWRYLVDTSTIIWRSLVFDTIPRAHAAAASYYRKAAASGNTRAAFLLALLYSYGYRPAYHDEPGNA